MTYGEVIKRCDELVSNSLSADYKLELLFEFECDIMLKVFLLAQSEIDALDKPSADTELSVKMPHSKIYRLWLCAMLHKSNGDYDDAANATADYEAARREFVQWYGRNTAPGRGQAEYKGYYLSAYALAVLCGYAGTVEEWLASLIGPKGDSYIITDADYEEIAAYCAEHYDEKIAEMTAVLDKVRGVSVTAEGGDAAAVTVEESEAGVTMHFTLPKGDKGDNGATFKPSVDADGNLSWSNDKGLKNPEAVNINGADGYTPICGVDYWTEADKLKMRGEFHDYLFYPSDGMPIYGNILSFINEEEFTKWKGTEGEDWYSGGDQNMIVFIAGVPKYFYSGWLGGGYIPFASPMLESEKAEIEARFGDIETALDGILAIQNTLIGGEGA